MCKVDTIIERYGLSAPDLEYASIDDYLIARWTGTDGYESDGYQALTTWFNKRVLKRVYEQQGRETLSVRLESEYEVLTGDDELGREELAADLATDGLSVDELREEFVSWSTMRRHLNDCLEASKERRQSTSNWELDSVDFARNKTVEKTNAALKSLATKNQLPDADKANIEVQVKLSCPECPTRVPIEDALERGYVCSEHFQDQPETAETISDIGSRIVAPLGALQALELGSSMLLEESVLITDVLTTVLAV
jgi:hypothetical protein